MQSKLTGKMYVREYTAVCSGLYCDTHTHTHTHTASPLLHSEFLAIDTSRSGLSWSLQGIFVTFLTLQISFIAFGASELTHCCGRD